MRKARKRAAAAAFKSVDLEEFQILFPTLNIKQDYALCSQKYPGDPPGRVRFKRWCEIEIAKSAAPVSRPYERGYVPEGWRSYLTKKYPESDFPHRWEMLPRSTQLECQRAIPRPAGCPDQSGPS
jgi:hypothetical protein